VANYQAALRAVTFRTDATTDSGSRTISFQVDDGAALNHASGPATRDFTVTHVNHPPAAVDDSASTDEESAISDVSVLGNDSDADGDAPLHISSIDTTGTVGHVSLAGGAISYTPTGHFDSLAQDATTTDTFEYTAADPGAADSAPATVTVTITGVNDAPALSSLESPALGYDTGSGTAALTASLAVSDVDSSNLDWAQVAITSGHSAGHDTLSFADQNGITGTFDDSAGTLTLTGSSSVANYQAALRAVTFRADATTPSGSRTVSFRSTTAGRFNHASPVVTRDITVTHVNHAPTATDDSASTNEDSAISDGERARQ